MTNIKTYKRYFLISLIKKYNIYSSVTNIYSSHSYVSCSDFLKLIKNFASQIRVQQYVQLHVGFFFDICVDIGVGSTTNYALRKEIYSDDHRVA
jgi:hypothetical protein